MVVTMAVKPATAATTRVETAETAVADPAEMAVAATVVGTTILDPSKP
jgi:hypothetical protein